MNHCEKPCDTSWVNLPEGEHDWGWYSVKTNREHCNQCTDPKCAGQEYDEDNMSIPDYGDDDPYANRRAQ